MHNKVAVNHLTKTPSSNSTRQGGQLVRSTEEFQIFALTLLWALQSLRYDELISPTYALFFYLLQ